MSETYKKLSEIQRGLIAKKGNFNSFGKYRYRSAEDILGAVKPLLDDSCFINISDEIVLVGERYYIKSTATFYHGTDKVTATAFAREPLSKKGMDESQITGSSASYARKMALGGLLAIDDTDDADVTNKHDDKPTAVVKRITKDQKEVVVAKIMELEYDDAQVLTLIKWASDNTATKLDDISESHANKLIVGLKKKLEQNG